MFSTPACVQVTEAINKYYRDLRKAHVQTAWEHWHRLHTEQIRSDKLRNAFRICYKAYSPHKENEVFALCPWIPGRYPRYTSRSTPGASPSPLRSSPSPAGTRFSRPSSRASDGGSRWPLGRTGSGRPPPTHPRPAWAPRPASNSEASLQSS